LDGDTNSVDMSEGQGSLECCSPWGRKELDTTKQLNNNTHTYTHIKEEEDFTGGTANKNLPANARDTDRFDPWSGEIPHATEQLGLCTQLLSQYYSPRAATTDPVYHD